MVTIKKAYPVYIGLAIGAPLLSLFALVSLFSNGSLIDGNTTENKATPEMSLFSSNAPALGSKDAPIKLVEYGDYQCFHCNRFFHEIEPRILKNYIQEGKVKMIFKDFTIIGQDSVTAAHASHCAREQEKFWKYHDILYSNWDGENTGWASYKQQLELAKKTGLDPEKFQSCMSSGKFSETIRNSNADAEVLGLGGTPAFFIIGHDKSVTRITGAQPYEVFEKIFDKELEKLK